MACPHPFGRQSLHRDRADEGARDTSSPTRARTASPRATPCDVGRSTTGTTPAGAAADAPGDDIDASARDRHRAEGGGEHRATSTPSSSASGRSPSRCASVAWASALTSSGVTKSRPVSQAHARAARSSAVAPRGLTPEAERRRLAGGAGDVDDVAGHLGRDLDLADRAPGRPRCRRHRRPAVTPGAGHVARVEAGRVPAQDLELGSRGRGSAARP